MVFFTETFYIVANRHTHAHMSIRATTSNESPNRYRCIVSHAEKLSFFWNEKSYKQLASRFPSTTAGLWVLRDVHIVDQHLCLVMAWLRSLWGQGRLHVVLSAPSLDAPRAWAKYISGSLPSLEGPERRLPQSLQIRYVPSLDARFIASWLHQQTLEGDVLVFAGSNCQRDQLALSLRVYSLEPVYVVRSHMPARIRRTPRVLVGGPSLDGLLTSCDAFFDGVQHVVDFGVCYKIRPDTGNDWEATPITRAMALARRSAVGKRECGVCLTAYKTDDWLDQGPLATHLLRTDLCQAKMMRRFPKDSLENLPVPLERRPPPNQVADVMTLLEVERPVAEMIQRSPTKALGIGLAAVVARATEGPFPKTHYEAMQRGEVGKDVAAITQRWALDLGTTMLAVVKDVRDTPWHEAVKIVAQAYRHTTAINAGARRLFIDALSGDLLYCKFSHTDMPAVAYTHRYKMQIVSYVPLPSSPARLRQVVVPFYEKNPRPAEVWFELRKVVAIPRPRTKELVLVCGQQVDIDTILRQWRDASSSRDLQTPLPVPVGPSMHIIFTAGLQLSDVVHDDDFALVEFDTRSLGLSELAKVHEMPATKVSENIFLLPSRDEVLQTCQTLTQARGIKASKLRQDTPKVRAELVIRTYLGRSTGRVTVRGPCHAWKEKVQASWGWAVAQNRIYLVPVSMDEFDVADMLGTDPFRIIVERSTNVITHLASVNDLVHELQAPVATHRTLRTNDKVVRLSRRNMQDVLKLVADLLPLRNEIVDQPLRCFWIVGTQPFAGARHGVVKDASTALHGLNLAMDLAEQELAALIPEMVWMPSLAKPTVYLHHRNIKQDGSCFLIYGSMEEREAAKRSLRLLDRRRVLAGNDDEICKICFEAEALFSLKVCGCKACITCLATTFEMKCRDPSFLGLLECPFCKTPVAKDDILGTVSELGLRIHALKMAAFLSRKKPFLIQECPARCGFFGRTGRNDKVLDCSTCGQRWCIGCTEAAGCLRKAHKGFCLQKGDTAFWKDFVKEATQAGAKPCPSCDAFVIKDEGCNHVTCIAPFCNTHFCWKCGDAFSHIQSSPLAAGTITKIDEDRVTVKVHPETWRPPCLATCPETITCKRSFATDMLLPGQMLEVNASVYVFSYIYDHIDSCAST